MILRQLKMMDAEYILEWMHDDYVVQNFKLPDEAKKIESVRLFIENSFSTINKHFAIVDDEDTYMGTVSLKNISLNDSSAEYAIVLTRNNIGKGIGRQATKLILEYAASELKLYRVYLNVLEQNARAIKMYEAIGFKWFRTTRENIRGTENNLSWYEIELSETII